MALVVRRLHDPRALWAGIAGPSVFTAVYFVEGARRPGYDPMRHQVSLLSLGEGGWIQVASFVLTGLCLLAFAVALRAHLREGGGSLAVPVGIAASGGGLLLAGIFTTQPLFGYPPGTPEGMATDVSPASLLHVTGAGLLFFGLIAAALALADRDRRAGRADWAIASALVATVVLVAFGLSGGGPSGLLFPTASGLLQRVALVAGLGWVAVLAVRALREVHRIASV